MASIIKANQLQDFGGNSILTSDGSGNVTIDNITTINATAMKNTPAFEALLSSSATINDNTYTKVTFDSEKFDTDNSYDNSNGKFQPQTAGKYFIYSYLLIDSTAGNMRKVANRIYKNGSQTGGTYTEINFHTNTSNDAEGGTATNHSIIDFNGSSDYIEVYAYADTVDGGTAGVTGDSNDERYSVFGAYRIIGA